MPIWKVISNSYSMESNNAIESEEVLEFETEDNSEKENSEEHKYNNSIYYSIKENELEQVIPLYTFINTFISFEELTPPPELS